MNNIYQEQDELTELTGADSWDEVVVWLSNLTELQIQDECDRCWQFEDNSDLAKRLHEALN